MSRFAKPLLACGAVVAAAGLLAVGLLWLLPAPSLYPGSGFSTAYLDRDGRLLRLTLAPDDRYRLYTPLDEIAPAVVEATTLYEDRWYFRHPGVNPFALGHAIWDMARGGRVRGASTITMQLVRLRDGIDTTRPLGKLVQMARALRLELHHHKRAILEAYLNLAPYGGNIEGIGAASRIYFGKPAARLSPVEAMTLAVIPQNPGARVPTRADGWREVDAARRRLWAAWTAADPGTAPGADDLRLRMAVSGAGELPFRAPHFVDALRLRGESARTLRTSLDLDLQTLVERQVDGHVAAHRSIGMTNASALLMNWQTREIVAMVGSADYFDDALHGQVNGTLAPRSPGSTLKPFIYALAQQQGLIHPMSLLKDAPRRFGLYTPENSDARFRGPMLARDALIQSRNVPAVDLLLRLHDDALWRLLDDAGVRNLRSPEHYGLALALGGHELTMAELVSLYAMLANLGDWAEPVWRADAPPPATRALMTPEAAFLTLEMLRHNPPVDRLAAGNRAPDYPVYWKTGTSYAFRDAWSIGIAGPYVLAVWIGDFEGRSNPAFVGRLAAAPLFFRIVRALAARDADAFSPQGIPPGLINVRQVDVCATTGDLPGEHCPSRDRSWFIPGVSPIRVNSIYRAVPVDRETGQRVCLHMPPGTRMEVFAFWPSDLAALFRQAGMAHRAPPPAPGCDRMDMAGSPPEIRSPDPRVTQVLTAGQREIALLATADADAGRLHWFADDGYLGSVAPGQPLQWSPRTGRHQLRVVDTRGRADAVWIAVESVSGAGSVALR